MEILFTILAIQGALLDVMFLLVAAELVIAVIEGRPKRTCDK